MKKQNFLIRKYTIYRIHLLILGIALFIGLIPLGCKKIDHWVKDLQSPKDPVVLKAIKWMERHHHKEAVPPLLQFLWDRYPHPYTARTILLIQSLLQEEYDSAQPIIEAISQFQQNPHEFAKKRKLIEELYRIALIKDTTNLSLYLRLVEINLKQKNFQDAIRSVEQASNLITHATPPQDLYTLFTLWGDIYFYQGKYYQAEQQYKRAYSYNGIFSVYNVDADAFLYGIYPTHEKKTLLSALIKDLHTKLDALMDAYRKSLSAVSQNPTPESNTDKAFDTNTDASQENQNKNQEEESDYHTSIFEQQFAQLPNALLTPNYTGNWLIRLGLQNYRTTQQTITTMLKEIYATRSKLNELIRSTNKEIQAFNTLDKPKSDREKELHDSNVSVIKEMRDTISNYQVRMDAQLEQVASLQEKRNTYAKWIKESFQTLYQTGLEWIKTYPGSPDKTDPAYYEFFKAYAIYLHTQGESNQWIPAMEALVADMNQPSNQPYFADAKQDISHWISEQSDYWEIQGISVSTTFQSLDENKKQSPSTPPNTENKAADVVYPLLYDIKRADEPYLMPCFVYQTSVDTAQVYDIISGKPYPHIFTNIVFENVQLQDYFRERVPHLLILQEPVPILPSHTETVYTSGPKYIFVNFAVKDTTPKDQYKPHLGMANLRIDRGNRVLIDSDYILSSYYNEDIRLYYYWFQVESSVVKNNQGRWNITVSIGDEIQQTNTVVIR